MSTSRRRFSDNPDSSSSYRKAKQLLPDIEVPYRDADPSTNEIPLSELDNFIIPARDDKGIAESTHFTMPPIMLRHIDVILHSIRFPYLRRADFLRHAVYRHIRYCVSLRRSLSAHMVVALEAIVEDCRNSEQQARVEAVLRKIEERMNWHLVQGDRGEAVRLLNVMRTRIAGVHEDYWSREVSKTLDEKFFKPMLTISGAPETGINGGGSGDDFDEVTM